MFLHNSRPIPPRPANEPVLSYAPGSNERAALKQALVRLASERHDIPLVIGGERVRGGRTLEVRAPHAHGQVLATLHEGGVAELDRGIGAARAAWTDWSRTSWSSRAAVFLRAAELVAGKYRQVLNGSTMLGQSKTAYQAEIDSACEFADFLRFNVHYASQLYAEQPDSAPGVWNASELRPLEGFVLAITPFNFTAIAANLPAAPALMGNTVVWKPSPLAAFSNHFVMQVFEEAGLPPGVINMVQGPAPELVAHALAQPDLAGVHFTGSTQVFQNIWRQIGERTSSYRAYPRVVGETGGKDFIVAHASADPDATITAIIRGAFEYQGQKCSAASRLYLASSLWKKIEKKMAEQIDAIKVGDVTDFTNFMGAVIDRRAYERLEGAIASARSDGACKVVAGGGTDDKSGYFVRPTLVRTENPHHDLMQRELFGPFVCAYVYDDGDYERTLDVVDATSAYALTGAVLATDRRAIELAHERLRHAAGNFYVNDKCTGAVVGQQPFGGARMSGTNDKAGSPFNLLRWVSPRTIKETFQPPTSYAYPFMLES